MRRALTPTVLSFAPVAFALLAGCGALGEGTPGNLSQAVTGPFRLTMMDIGQGDGLMVRAPSGCTALLDAGPSGNGAAIKSYLRSLGVTTIDFAINSHLHADHLGSLDEVDSGTDAIPVGRVYDRGGNYSSTDYNQYATRFAGRRQTPTVGQIISLCNEVQFRVIAINGNGQTSTDENALSLVVKVSYGAFDALVGGDLTGSTGSSGSGIDVESGIAPTVGEVEVYKVHHHGSRYSSNTTLLNTLLPTVSIISVGRDNPYGHPTAEALGRLDGVGSDIWQTEDPDTNSLRGHIEITSTDGTAYTVTQGTSSQGYGSKGAADTTPPSAPTNLSATAVSSSQINLAWNASTDNVAVAGYRVFRGGSQIATTSTTSYSNTGLTASTTYSYTVVAYDAAGNTSASSNTASATTSTGGTAGQVIINEILANEPGSNTAAEFVELVNVGGSSVNISGWTISDATSVRHTFAANTTLAAGKALVVYAAASGIPGGLTNAVAASTGTLSLNNTTDTVTVRNSGGTTVNSFAYPSTLASVDGVSANRSPDASASGTFVLHNTISSLASSGGRRANGTNF